MDERILLVPVLAPLAAGLIALAGGRLSYWISSLAALFTAAGVCSLSLYLFGTNLTYTAPMGVFGWEFSFRLYHTSGFMLAAAGGFATAVALYSVPFMRTRARAGQFFAYYLFTLAFTCGAVLADNLLVLLFFWEGLLVMLFAMVAVGEKGAYKTAMKAFTIVGVSDLCMMFGIALTAKLAGTMTISKISLGTGTMESLAFVLLMIGAVSKAGSMPFHSWIPDAAKDSYLPFMAFLPAALEKLLGIYFLARISLDMFSLTPGSWLSPFLMIIGCITIILAVMMALVQKDYKKLLSYHAISQVGYMILGIGTAIPVGIVGGLFHMINHAMYKSCLFLTGGSVEKQAGTTDLAALGGIGRAMPVTFACFIVAAASISGVPPFNGFFSKELVYDAALVRGMPFYIAALVGSFFTAASFLKLGHAAYLGKRQGGGTVKEAPVAMLLPMLVIAGLCILFGVWNDLPLRGLIQPILGDRMPAGKTFSGMPHNAMLVVMTLVVLGLALVNHVMAARATGGGLKASDHIKNAAGLSWAYRHAEAHHFDPYYFSGKGVYYLSRMLWRIDRGFDWLFDGLAAGTAEGAGRAIRAAHTGNISVYIVAIIAAVFVMALYLLW